MADPAAPRRFCAHCGTPIAGRAFIEAGGGFYLGEECYFRNTYLDGIVAGIEATYLATIEAFVTAIDSREHETGNHSVRVTRLAIILAHAHGLRDKDLADFYCGALLHDLGKIGVPDAVLLKKGSLSEEELRIMRTHPENGYRIIAHIGYLAPAAELIRAHHEHFDGSGYPRGLAGEAIPLGARIFAAADALDALTVTRPYHRAIPFEKAAGEIRKASGRIFDPAVVATLEKTADELRMFVGKLPPPEAE